MSFDEIFGCPKQGPDDGLWIRTIGGQCPVQADGTMWGCPFYFRARHGSWWFYLSEPGIDPVEGPWIHEAEGDDDDDGYMPETVALSIIWNQYATLAKPPAVSGKAEGRQG
jgi:hypothetical protein